jgi:hypothetical protein
MQAKGWGAHGTFTVTHDITALVAMPKAAEPRSLSSLRDKLIKIDAKVVSHGRYVTFHSRCPVVARLLRKRKNTYKSKIVIKTSGSSKYALCARPMSDSNQRYPSEICRA